MLNTGLTERELEARVDAYRERLRREMGLEPPGAQPFKRPRERRFVASERPHSTVIYCGLTRAHEDIALGAFQRMGYSVQRLPVPDNEAYELGREYCNRGQCNPTYYIVGNLLKFLFQQRQQGLSPREIEDRYVLAWGADCGPCRMGMYEADLRKALKDAGFPNFRIANLDISNGLDVDQSTEDDGLQLKPLFFLNLAKAMMSADILNDVTNKIRPYEVHPGDTDRALERAKAVLHDAGQQGRSVIAALRRARQILDGVEVDYLRVKPKVKITGEFWAKLTPGEGNYRLRSWLEEEGAEVIMDPVGAWFEYMIWLNDMKVRDRMGIQPDARGLGNVNPWLILAGLHMGKLAYEGLYNFYRALLNFKADPLPNMKRLDRYAQGYYTRQSIAGEGHLEVTKHIMSMREEKAHMMISVKPFGCMPSTISDGVQAKLVTDFAESVFVAVETNADGEVLVKSRVQMKLQEARQKAREEFQRVLDAYGVTVDEVRAYAQRHRLMRAMRRIPHEHGVVGTAAHFVADVARRMGHRPLTAKLHH